MFKTSNFLVSVFSKIISTNRLNMAFELHHRIEFSRVIFGKKAF